MKETAQLAGFLAAEAILQLAKGRTLSPLIIFENADGTTHIMRIHEADGQKAAYQGEKILQTNKDGATRGVMVIDAFLNLPRGRSDALFLQARQFVPVAEPMILAVPYRPASKAGGFAVHRPKIFAFEGEQLPEADLIAAFFRGVDKHETGGRFWQEHFDDSY